MFIIAIRQSSSKYNNFFITNTYDEFTIDQILPLVDTGKVANARIATSKSGKKYIRCFPNKTKADNSDLIAITCNQKDYLFFDGNFIILKSINGKTKKSWPAQSGKTGSKPSDQNQKDFGPLPEGEYTARFDQTLDVEHNKGIWDALKWIYKSPQWGLIVTPLEPSPKNNMYGRDDFTIHGGFFPGSKGCIDLQFNNGNFHTILRLYKRNLKLIVKYPK